MIVSFDLIHLYVKQNIVYVRLRNTIENTNLWTISETVLTVNVSTKSVYGASEKNVFISQQLSFW